MVPRYFIDSKTFTWKSNSAGFGRRFYHKRLSVNVTRFEISFGGKTKTTQSEILEIQGPDKPSIFSPI